MIKRNRRAGPGRIAAPALLLLIQALAATFFLGDVFGDWLSGTLSPHLVVEALVSIALVTGLAAGAVDLRRTLERVRAQEVALATASGALAEVIEAQFTAWGLTAAEHDVGLFALKGLDVAEIAAVRGAAHGTVRAQLSRVYTKAGVSGRAQFAAFFVEDLMADGIRVPAGRPLA